MQSGCLAASPPPVSYSTGREVGPLDTQVLEKLQETFLYRQFYFCHHVIPLLKRYYATAPAGVSPAPGHPGSASLLVRQAMLARTEGCVLQALLLAIGFVSALPQDLLSR